MFNRSFFYLVIVSTLLFAGCLIKGKVVDENGVGIAGVTVTLSDNADMTTTTDGNGEYQFGTLGEMLSAGNYTVTPSGNFTPASRSVTLAVPAKPLDGFEEVPLPATNVNFDQSTSGASIVGVWKIVLIGVPGDQYLHFFSDGTCGSESSLYSDENGDTVNSPLLVLGTYTYEDEILTIFLDSAKDVNGAAFNTERIDNCWFYSPYFYSVALSSLYVKDESSMTTPELRSRAGGMIAVTPDLPSGCSGISPIPILFNVKWAAKHSDNPGSYILNDW